MCISSSSDFEDVQFLLIENKYPRRYRNAGVKHDMRGSNPSKFWPEICVQIMIYAPVMQQK